jgi:hypothetical protein
MLDYKDVVSQAQDKHRENLEWIERETELRKATEPLQLRRKEPRESTLRWAINMMQSIALLLIPGVGQRANR